MCGIPSQYNSCYNHNLFYEHQLKVPARQGWFFCGHHLKWRRQLQTLTHSTKDIDETPKWPLNAASFSIPPLVFALPLCSSSSSSSKSGELVYQLCARNVWRHAIILPTLLNIFPPWIYKLHKVWLSYMCRAFFTPIGSVGWPIKSSTVNQIERFSCNL